MFFFDKYYLILVVPALILAIIAQINVKSAFSRYRKITNRRYYTGADVARAILDSNGLYDVRVQMVSGELTDHYDPRDKVVRLSEPVYSSTSLAAVGVAAHETGHAIQHKDSYGPLVLRSNLVPMANIGSGIGPYMAVFGLFLGYPILTNAGIILFSIAVLFYLITLPVEFNASSRAIQILESKGILSYDELPGAKKVLNAAAMTYVASALVAMANLLRLVLLANSRRDD